MALTKVGPAGIGSTPGTGYVIGNSFLHSTGLDSTNAKFTGIVTAQTFRVLGNFQVDGTTTTLDTEVTSVDKLEVAANNTTVGVAITQSGSGDILNLYDGSTAVFSVKDGGNVILGTNATYANDTANDLQVGQTSSSNSGITIGSSGQGQVAFADAGANRAGLINYNHGSDAMIFYTNGPSNERLRITSAGKLLVGSTITSNSAAIQGFSAHGNTAGESGVTSADTNAMAAGIGGEIAFYGKTDGTATPYNYLGHIRGIKENGTNANTACALTFYTRPTLTAPQERLRITSDGLIGIGTNAPFNNSSDIDIRGGSSALSDGGQIVTIGVNNKADDTPQLAFGVYDAPNGYAWIRSYASGVGGQDLVFASVAENLRITSAGLVGIGTAAPTDHLQILHTNNGKGLTFKTTENHFAQITADSNRTGAGNHLLAIEGHWNGTPVAEIALITGSDTTNKDDGEIIFRTSSANNLNTSEKLRISADGRIGINASNNTSYDANADDVLIASDGNTGITIRSVGSTPFAMIHFADGTTDNSQKRAGRIMYQHDGDNLTFHTANTERLRITGSGVVGINKSSPSSEAQLDVVGSSYWPILVKTTSTGGGGVAIKNKDDVTSLYTGSGGSAWLTGSVITDGLVRAQNNLIFASNGNNERLRITSDGNVLVGTTDATIYNNGDSDSEGIVLRNGEVIDIARKGDLQLTLNRQTNDGPHIGFFRSGGAKSYISTRNDAFCIDVNSSERLRITSTGKIGLNMSPTFELDLTGRFRATHGSSGLFFEEINNGAALWLDGANGDFSGGDYYGIIANNSARLQFGYAGAAHMELNSSGQLYLGSYPHDHTVAGGSHLKLRAGAGAWGISLGMRASQNDYAYFGFTDMNGDEQIGDIFMQRTGTSTGHMVFSTNNGNTGSTNRMRIGPSGRLCVSPSANFTSESSSFVMTVVNNGNGSSGGYPGINIRSVASGGTTNSAPGMTLCSTDSNWTLYTASGNVHGLGILVGNTANSGNAAMYIRSDKKVITGPTTLDELDTATSSNTAFCVTGGGLSVGSLGNGGDTVQGGRNVIGWYMYRYNGSTAYAHLTTSLWGGGSPAGESMYIMGGFRIHGYRYSGAGVSEENIYFHNWGGNLANYSRYHWGNWDPGNTAYVNSSGYVTLRLSNGSYYGYDIDLIQHAWYPIRDIKVTNVTYNGNATI